MKYKTDSNRMCYKMPSIVLYILFFNNASTLRCVGCTGNNCVFLCPCMCPGVAKKVDAIGKERDCQPVRGWRRSIVNHLFWSASTSQSGQEMVAKWTSVANHVQDVHTHDDDLFPDCLHQPLTGEDSREWLKPSIQPHTPHTSNVCFLFIGVSLTVL